MITGVGGHQQAEQKYNVECVRQKVWSNRRLTVRTIADELDMDGERVWRIITEDLGMRKICAKMVPSLLNERQKERRVQVCQNIFEQLETTPNLLKRVVTGNESWIFEYDSLTKRLSLEWKSALSPRPKKARVFKSKTKVMLITFLMSMELSPQNSCRKAKLLIYTSTKHLATSDALSEGEKKKTERNEVMAASL